MRNPVSKNDFNRGGWHKDDKNDYDRQALKRDLEKELDIEDETFEEEDQEIEEARAKLDLLAKEMYEVCGEIALKEYARSSGCICINKYS